jgi:glycosyltransferase involved in cell wall biosynthesis
MRAFWREERLALGLLRAGSPQERVMHAVEGAAARHSTAIITLSGAAVDVLERRYGAGVAAKCRVITTCVDLERFALSPLPDADTLRLLLAGTLSPLYDVRSMLRLFQRIRARRPAALTVLTPDASTWGAAFDAAGAMVGSAPAASMPERVASHHIGMSMRTLDVSNAAATPTKLGEFLACGRPVVVSPGLGDMDELVAKHDCGVVVDDLSDEGLDRAAAALDRLVADPDTPSRCRALAEEYFDLDRGVDQLLEAHRAVAG